MVFHALKKLICLSYAWPSYCRRILHLTLSAMFIFTGFRNVGVDTYTCGPSKLANWLLIGYFFFSAHILSFGCDFSIFGSQITLQHITLTIFNYSLVRIANDILWAISLHMAIQIQIWTEESKISVSSLIKEWFHLITKCPHS